MSALSQVYSDLPRRRGRRGFSACRPTLAALAVSAVAGLAIFATAAGSLMEDAMAAPPAMKSSPPGWIDVAFADVDAASSHSAMPAQPTQVVQPQSTQKQDAKKSDPCADFVYFFLNTTCSAKRVSAARRDGIARRAIAARTILAPSKQEASRNPERVTFAATTTTAAD